MDNRIRILRKTLGLTQKEFAEKLGIQQNTVSCMERADTAPTQKNIKLICSQFSVNEDWLLHGVEPMFLVVDKKQKEFFDIFNELTPTLQDHLISTAKELLKTQMRLQETEELTTPEKSKPHT